MVWAIQFRRSALAAGLSNRRGNPPNATIFLYSTAGNNINGDGGSIRRKCTASASKAWWPFVANSEWAAGGLEEVFSTFFGPFGIFFYFSNRSLAARRRRALAARELPSLEVAGTI